MLPHECVDETTISLSTAAPPPPDRRRQQRHLTILRIGALIVDGTRELCLVRNISAGGVMAHVYRHLEIGTRVAVEIKNDDPLPGRVVWESDSNVGIAFDQKIDVPDLLATSKLLGDGRRARRPRVQINRLAKVRCGAEVYFLDALDISQGGVKVAVEQDLPIDADVVVTLDGFRPLPGIVRWVANGHCGISFIQVIPIAELCEWLRSGE
ncbi:MAG TPA: PilZ domain-containing protein [Allosphingosinicella sp.]|jgi:hypothetical protein|nr:PilZ domain-containing protein [Allosphingosinicella sp.]